MLLSPSQALTVLRAAPFDGVFEGVTLLTGAPVAAEGSVGFVGVISTQEHMIDIEVLGPYDETFLDAIAARTDPLDEGVEVEIDGEQHTVAMFARCVSKRKEAMRISFSFEIDPFA